MSTTNNFKSGLNKLIWGPCSPPLYQGATQLQNGSQFIGDLRNNSTRIPALWLGLGGSSDIVTYDPITNEWGGWLCTNTAGSFLNGGGLVFHPRGPRGTIAAGATTTSVVLSTPITSVVANQLANRGDGTGHLLRIIDNAAGASGKTEEVTITGNTSGTTPTITFTPALTFTPTSGSAYEFLSGTLYQITPGTSFRSIDVISGTVTSLSATNLASSTECVMHAFSELYVSNDRSPGDGFIDDASTYNNTASKCITATAADSTSITASALAAPSSPSLAANEYRNFQVRIVEDTGTPTAVGQRRNITSHTSGSTPKFTVPSWSVTPSATAKFVIEQNDDRILALTGSAANAYSYSISGNAWDSATTWSSPSAARAIGAVLFPTFGITRDASGNRSQGAFWILRGGSTASVDYFDITAAATGTWTNGVSVSGFSASGGHGLQSTLGVCGIYDPVSLAGRYGHLTGLSLVTGVNQNPLQRFFRFDVFSGILKGGTYLPYPGLNSGSSTGNRLAMGYHIDGSTKIGVLYARQPYTSVGEFLFSLPLGV